MAAGAKREPTTAPTGGFIFRAATLDDLERIVELYNAYWEPLLGMQKLTVEDVRNQLTTPGFEMDTSTRLVETSDGRLIGGIMVADLNSPPIHPGVLGCVHPDFEGHGIGTDLIKWAEERARQAIPRVPDGTRVSMHLNTSPSHQPTTRLFEKLGLQAVRYSLFMVTDLDEPPPEPKWPENIVLRTFQDYPELPAVYRAVDEAFRDHWGYIERSEEESLERIRHRIENDPDHDPSLWFLAMDGDEIAGISLCHPKTGDDANMGWVNSLGVRRPWRRQGLALALLHHSFGELYRRGKRQVGLGVDAGSLTGATRLYEKAGMYVARQLVTYEKELRPGKELARQSIDD
jgi:mycothiol synthase